MCLDGTVRAESSVKGCNKSLSLLPLLCPQFGVTRGQISKQFATVLYILLCPHCAIRILLPSLIPFVLCVPTDAEHHFMHLTCCSPLLPLLSSLHCLACMICVLASSGLSVTLMSAWLLCLLTTCLRSSQAPPCLLNDCQCPAQASICLLIICLRPLQSSLCLLNVCLSPMGAPVCLLTICLRPLQTPLCLLNVCLCPMEAPVCLLTICLRPLQTPLCLLIICLCPLQASLLSSDHLPVPNGGSHLPFYHLSLLQAPLCLLITCLCPLQSSLYLLNICRCPLQAPLDWRRHDCCPE